MTGIQAKPATSSTPTSRQKALPHGAKRKNQRNAQRIALLSKHWPRFSQDGGLPPLPLSIGIDKQIRDNAVELGIEISEREIRHGLNAYAKRISYLRVIANGGMRVDLFSNETESVAPEHQADALNMLNALKDKRKAKAKKHN